MDVRITDKLRSNGYTFGALDIIHLPNATQYNQTKQHCASMDPTITPEQTSYTSISDQQQLQHVTLQLFTDIQLHHLPLLPSPLPLTLVIQWPSQALVVAQARLYLILLVRHLNLDALLPPSLLLSQLGAR